MVELAASCSRRMSVPKSVPKLRALLLFYGRLNSQQAVEGCSARVSCVVLFFFFIVLVFSCHGSPVHGNRACSLRDNNEACTEERPKRNNTRIVWCSERRPLRHVPCLAAQALLFAVSP